MCPPPSNPSVAAEAAGFDAHNGFKWTRRHVIRSADLSKPEIEEIITQARTFADILNRPVKKVPTLRGKVVVNMFYENSTRTRTSFELAGKYLSADTLNFGVSTSAVKKGETLLDTVETLVAMGTDSVIIRHPSSGVCEQLVAHADEKYPDNKLCVLNAGDGQHDHPSQGLLDLYTLLERVPNLTGKKVVIVGDVTHSRVARSNMAYLPKFGVDLHLLSPTTLVPAHIHEFGFPVHHDPKTALADADIVMCLRLQLERQKAGLLPSLAEYSSLFGITQERLKAYCKPDVVVMHPGPMNRGIEIASDVADDPEHSVITQQVTSGVAIRMALLYLTLGATQEGGFGNE